MLGVTLPLNPGHPYYSGAVPVSGEVPHPYPVALGGRPYMLDTSRQWGRASIPLLRGQADQGTRPGEASLNPDDLWRRAVETWHHGAGQSWADREDSDPARFRSSKGVDVWEKWGACLHADTDQKRSSANTNLRLAAVGSRLYLTDGNSLLYTEDVTVDTPTWTTVTGTPAAAANGLATDGFNVWAGFAANGVYATTRTTGSAAAYVTGTPSVTALGYAKGRLMVGVDNAVYNVTATGALPTALMSHANSDFDWVAFAEGAGHIYAAGFSGDKSLIYRIAIKPDATSLDAPIVAGTLLDGEIVRGLGDYVGGLFVLIGTDKGVRPALADPSGNLEIGALIETPNAVRCFEGQERFVWFGWTNYDAASTGLGRMDLETFIAPNTPASASDLMVTGQGIVTSVVTFQNLRVFAVSGLGVYAQHTTKVGQGHIDSGDIGYNLPDPKVAMFLDVRHDPLAGSVQPSVSVDGGSFVPVGTSDAVSSTGERFPLGGRKGDRHEIRLTLNRSTVDTATGPNVTRATLEAYPAPARRGRWKLPLLLRTSLTTNDDVERDRNVRDDMRHIIDLAETGHPTTLQVGGETFDCVVADYEFTARETVQNGDVWDGTCEVDVKLLSST